LLSCIHAKGKKIAQVGFLFLALLIFSPKAIGEECQSTTGSGDKAALCWKESFGTGRDLVDICFSQEKTKTDSNSYSMAFPGWSVKSLDNSYRITLEPSSKENVFFWPSCTNLWSINESSSGLQFGWVCTQGWDAIQEGSIQLNAPMSVARARIEKNDKPSTKFESSSHPIKEIKVAFREIVVPPTQKDKNETRRIEFAFTNCLPD